MTYEDLIKMEEAQIRALRLVLDILDITRGDVPATVSAIEAHIARIEETIREWESRAA